MSNASCSCCSCFSFIPCFAGCFAAQVYPSPSAEPASVSGEKFRYAEKKVTTVYENAILPPPQPSAVFSVPPAQEAVVAPSFVLLSPSVTLHNSATEVKQDRREFSSLVTAASSGSQAVSTAWVSSNISRASSHLGDPQEPLSSLPGTNPPSQAMPAPQVMPAPLAIPPPLLISRPVSPALFSSHLTSGSTESLARFAFAPLERQPSTQSASPSIALRINPGLTRIVGPAFTSTPYNLSPSTPEDPNLKETIFFSSQRGTGMVSLKPSPNHSNSRGVILALFKELEGLDKLNKEKKAQEKKLQDGKKEEELKEKKEDKVERKKEE